MHLNISKILRANIKRKSFVGKLKETSDEKLFFAVKNMFYAFA